MLAARCSMSLPAPESSSFALPAGKQCHCALWSCGCVSSPAPRLLLQFIRLATHCSRLHAASFISGATFCYKTLFSICAHITQLATPNTRRPFLLSLSLSRPERVCVCSTYLAFVFIFSVIVLFLPCHGNSCSAFLSLSLDLLFLSPSPILYTACVHATYHLWIRSVHSLGRLMLLIIITSIMTGFL